MCGEEFDAIEIDGDAALEARYRASVPVVEVDGERAFTYFVSPDALRSGSRPARRRRADGCIRGARTTRWHHVLRCYKAREGASGWRNA